jgi:hypothetical protein
MSHGDIKGLTGKTTNRRGEPKKTGLVDGMNERQHRQRRAKERAEARGDRSNTQQLAELDRRLGANAGALRERLRLLDRMATGRAA